MTNRVQITFHGVDESDALRALILKWASKLERFSDRIISCRVAIEQPNHRHRQGNEFRVRIDLKVPEKELVIDRLSEKTEDLYKTIGSAFEAVERRLVDQFQRRNEVRPNIKTA